MKMEKTECSETSAYKIQTPGNYPEENTQHADKHFKLQFTTDMKCSEECPHNPSEPKEYKAMS
jgi:hypothetical protein